jgi:hypothetical protein
MRTMQIGDVAAVEDVEAPIRKNDSLSVGVINIAKLAEFSKAIDILRVYVKKPFQLSRGAGACTWFRNSYGCRCYADFRACRHVASGELCEHESAEKAVTRAGNLWACNPGCGDVTYQSVFIECYNTIGVERYGDCLTSRDCYKLRYTGSDLICAVTLLRA